MTRKQENFRVRFDPPKQNPKDIKSALITAWLHTFHSSPPPGSIEVLMAHQALETGRWGHMPNYNLGGIRPSSDDQLWTSFVTFEVLTVDVGREWVKKSTLAEPCMVVSTFPDGRVKIQAAPLHPATIFRAFETLEEGIQEYFNVLYNRFSKCWSAVISGDPSKFVQALKDQHYFTGDLGQYSSAVVSLFKEFSK